MKHNIPDGWHFVRKGKILEGDKIRYKGSRGEFYPVTKVSIGFLVDGFCDVIRRRKRRAK
jgi:hypothetical protein